MRKADLFGMELLNSWRTAKSIGLTQREHARELGMRYTTYKSRMYRALIDEGSPKSSQQETTDEDKFEQSADNNKQELTYTGKERITTLEQLIEYFEIDLDVWKVDRWVANKWEVGAKHPATGEIVISPLIQVKAWLSRKIYEPVEYSLRPLSIPRITPIDTDNRYHGHAWRLELTIPDLHIGYRRDLRTGKLEPFHDRKFMDIIIQVVSDLQPDTITQVGDAIDFGEVSDKFLQSPDMYFVIQPSLIEHAWWWRQIGAVASRAELDELEGNHDERLKRALLKHTVWAYGLKPIDDIYGPDMLSFERLASMESLGVTWHDGYPDNEVWRGDGLRIIHGNIARKQPGSTTRAELEMASAHTIMGHIHRREQVTQIRAGKEVSVTCPGAACRIDYAVPGHSRGQNWQQGFCLTYYGDDDAMPPQIVPVIDGTAFVNGKIYIGRDYIETLREDMNGDWGF